MRKKMTIGENENITEASKRKPESITFNIYQKPSLEPRTCKKKKKAGKHTNRAREKRSGNFTPEEIACKKPL
ncbi:MAG: hypothetical protein GY774_15755 [Planctomycetes bacterium]|nr:hypothetical protein [Planctomycetota bacterium]